MTVESPASPPGELEAFGERVSTIGALRHHSRMVKEHFWFTVLGGSFLLPGTVRKLILRWFGADLRSAPGAGFRFGGDPRNLVVAEEVYFNRGVYVECVGPVTIGRNTSIGMDAMIVTSHHEMDAQGCWAKEPSGRPVTIGERVWIGARALVLPGARIESDVIVAAGAVVTGRCAAGGLYAGVPARRIRELTGVVSSAE